MYVVLTNINYVHDELLCTRVPLRTNTDLKAKIQFLHCEVHLVLQLCSDCKHPDLLPLHLLIQLVELREVRLREGDPKSSVCSNYTAIASTVAKF